MALDTLTLPIDLVADLRAAKVRFDSARTAWTRLHHGRRVPSDARTAEVQAGYYTAQTALREALAAVPYRIRVSVLSEFA